MNAKLTVGQFKLSTKSFGKKAKREVSKLLPTARRFYTVGNMSNIYDKDNNHIGFVIHGGYTLSGAKLESAELRIF